MPRTLLYRRLWLAGISLALFLITLLVGNCFLNPAKALRWNMLGYDFRTWYIAGTLAREGRSAEFYDLQSIERFDRQLAADHGLDLDQGIGPIFNPPFFAWIFAPLARWPYPTALKIWYAVSVGCLLLSAMLLSRFLAPAEEGGITKARRHEDKCEEGKQGISFAFHFALSRLRGSTDAFKMFALVVLLLATSLPAVQAFAHAQNTFLSLLMLTCVVTVWRSGRAMLAGLLAGLLFYKPQLGAVVSVAVIVTMGWRAALGLAMTGISLLLVNLITLPGSLTDFFAKMPANLRWMQEEHVYAWHRHATFQGFWRTLLQWHQTGPASGVVRVLSGISMIAVALGLISLMKQVAWASRPCSGGSKSTDETSMPPLVIAATITAMPLLMPFYFDYDLLLLAVVAVLTAEDFMRNGREFHFFADRWLPTAWVLFSAAMYLNLPISRLTHMSPLVPSLCFLACLTMSRANRQIKMMKASEPRSLSDDIITSRCAA